MKTRPSLRRALGAAAVLALAADSYSHAADVDSVWFGGTANWNNSANWANTPSVTQFPNNGNGGLTYDATVSAGTATQTTNLTIEALTFSGGNIAGAGFDLNLNQMFNWTGGNLSGTGNVNANGGINFTGSNNKPLSRTLNNSGSATWSGTGGVSGTGTFNNLSGAFFNADGTGTAFGIPQLNNSGTIFKTLPGSAANFGGVLTLNNTGTVNVATGTLNVNGTVTQASAGTLSGGTWIVSGTLNLNGVAAPITTLGSGASVTLSGSSSLFTKVDGLSTNQGSFTVSGGRNFTTAGPFSNTGTLTVGASSILAITTSLAQQPGSTLTGGTYFVGGSLTLPGASITTNQANFTLDGATSLCTKINSLADNQGTFTISNGRNFTAAGALDNSGTLHAGASSTLTLGSGGTHTGSFVVDSSGAVNLDGGTHTFNTGASFSGAGFLNINNAVIVTGNANLTAPAFTNWNGGTIGGGGGSLDIPSGGSFKTPGPSFKTLNGIINNSGTTQWMGSSGVFGSGTFNNLLGASFQILSGSTNAFGAGQFNNAGTITKSNGGANNFGGAMTFNNTGTVEVTSGTLNINGTVTQVSSGTLTGGTWKATNATIVLTSGANLSTIGSAAAVSLSGAGSVLAKINTLADNQGGFTITNARNFSTVGNLANSGTIVVGLNSTLTVNGIFTNSGDVTGDLSGIGTVIATSYAMQSGTVSVPLGGTVPLTKTTAGTATLSATNTYTGGTNVQAGTLVVNRLHENNPVSITGGTLQIPESSPDLASGHPAGDNAFVSRPGSMITISNNGAAYLSRVYNGTLDLGNNDLIVDYAGSSPIADVEDMVRSGYNGGDWLGAGIASSTAASIDAFGAYVLAVCDNAEIPVAFSTFSGQAVDTTTVLVKFTHRADVNMDGVVTVNDSVLFNGNYSEGDFAKWSTGDQNYDGVYSINDSVLFNGSYDESLMSLPEPATIGLLGLSLAGIPQRRRRR